jgi:hypothetical protein
MLNVYVLKRLDDWGYDECIEQTIVCESEERAIELANKEYGDWGIKIKVDLNIEQVLTKETNDG